MKRLVSPFIGMSGYRCFGCDPNNENGLRMTFIEDGEDILCRWKPTQSHQGWINTLHGGIQATLIDETAGWVVFRKLNTSGMTVKMEVRYNKPVSTLEEEILIKARLTKLRLGTAYIDVQIINGAGEVCTESTCIYHIFSREVADKEFFFRDCKVEDI